MHNIPARALLIFGEALIDDFPDQKIVGGAPFNVARVSACFGGTPLMITRIGNDANAQLVKDEMQRFDLNQSGVQIDPVYPTGLVQVHVEAASHRFEIMADQAYDHIDNELAKTAADHYLNRPTVVNRPALMYFGTLAQRHSTSRDTLINLLTTRPSTNYLDLNLRAGQYTENEIMTSLLHADILKANEDELQILVKKFNPSAGILNCHLASPDAGNRYFEAMEHLLMRFKLSAIIVTLGPHGYLYANNQGLQLNGHQATPKQIEVVDTVGCGDAFSSIFLAGLINDWPLDETLQRAHEFAGAVCTIRGAVGNDLNFYLGWQKTWAQSQCTIAPIGTT